MKENLAPGPNSRPRAIDSAVTIQCALRNANLRSEFRQRAVAILRLQLVGQFAESELAALSVFDLCEDFFPFAHSIVVRDGVGRRCGLVLPIVLSHGSHPLVRAARKRSDPRLDLVFPPKGTTTDGHGLREFAVAKLLPDRGEAGRVYLQDPYLQSSRTRGQGSSSATTTSCGIWEISPLRERRPQMGLLEKPTVTTLGDYRALE